MHVLLFQVGSEQYAVGTAGVVEVVPAVDLRAVPRTHDAVAGLLEYRGRIVPIVDLCQLFGQGACPRQFSNRIIVCDLATQADAAVPDAVRWIGMLAQNVTRDAVLDPDQEGAHPGPRTPDAPVLGPVLASDAGLVQLVRIEALLPQDLIADLVAGNPSGDGE